LNNKINLLFLFSACNNYFIQGSPLLTTEGSGEDLCGSASFINYRFYTINLRS